MRLRATPSRERVEVAEEMPGEATPPDLSVVETDARERAVFAEVLECESAENSVRVPAR